ncbi:hypothetical protein MHYP_G00273110 [Metynnis hypsauchen]
MALLADAAACHYAGGRGVRRWGGEETAGKDDSSSTSVRLEEKRGEDFLKFLSAGDMYGIKQPAGWVKNASASRVHTLL